MKSYLVWEKSKQMTSVKKLMNSRHYKLQNDIPDQLLPLPSSDLIPLPSTCSGAAYINPRGTFLPSIGDIRNAQELFASLQPRTASDERHNQWHTSLDPNRLSSAWRLLTRSQWCPDQPLQASGKVKGEVSGLHRLQLNYFICAIITNTLSPWGHTARSPPGPEKALVPGATQGVKSHQLLVATHLPETFALHFFWLTLSQGKCHFLLTPSLQ